MNSPAPEAKPSLDASLGASLDDLLARAGQLFMSSPTQALALADEALALLQVKLPALENGAPSAPHALARRARGIALHYAGRHAEGLAELNRALAATPEADLGLRSRVLRALSMGCELHGAVDGALGWAKQSLDAARGQSDQRLIRDALLSVGVAHSRAGDVEAGLAHFDQVLALFEASGESTGCMSVLNNMGINCKNLGRHADAIAHFERGLAFAEQVGDAAGSAVLRSNLGEPLLALGRLEEARRELAIAIDALASCGYREAEINARVTHGRVLLALGDSDAAQAELEHALRAAQSTGGRNYAARAHQTLAELHKAAGRFEAALQHHEAFHAAERAQFNADSDKAINSLRVQLEVADARHDAELHRLKHVEIAQAHDELKALHAALLAADDEKTALLERLAEHSRTDSLTGLANRRWLDERLAEELQRSRRHAKPLAVAMCDLDFFKRINDRFGHAIGDEVLRRVAAILRERCRSTDLIARYGGEEFCIAFLEADAEHAARSCEVLRAAVAAHDWRSVHPALEVTLSIGISDQREGLDAHALLADADMHLYRAKRDGKNCVRWHGA
jgi:diguanylate cyclase (GGDEF)-like protein